MLASHRRRLSSRQRGRNTFLLKGESGPPCTQSGVSLCFVLCFNATWLKIASYDPSSLADSRSEMSSGCNSFKPSHLPHL